MKIAILDLTTHPEPLLTGLPRVHEQTVAWLSQGLPEADYVVVDVAEGGAPMPALESFDGVVLTGSEFGVYDDVPWMAPLRGFLNACRAARKPVYGICFGHQIMADTWGGKAEKSPEGAVIGAQDYQIGEDQREVLVWHQDQVTEVPPSARVTASAGYCPVGALEYDFPAASVQFHPEHRADHIGQIYEKFRGAEIPEEKFGPAMASLQTSEVAVDEQAHEAAAFFRAHISRA